VYRSDTYRYLDKLFKKILNLIFSNFIPPALRPAFLEYSTLQLFFYLYSSLPASLSPLALSCLVQPASVRRSLFNNAERGKFLNQLVVGVSKILKVEISCDECGKHFLVIVFVYRFLRTFSCQQRAEEGEGNEVIIASNIMYIIEGVWGGQSSKVFPTFVPVC
jgi:hypothetical protein